MTFIHHMMRDKKDNAWALSLGIVFFLFYVGMNAPFLVFMERNADLLLGRSPFYGVPFTLNLFNFDPSMYYGAGNATMIHPLLNYLSGPLNWLAHRLGGNTFFLAVQSAVNALGVMMLYFYMRGDGQGRLLAAVFAALFGASAYSLFTAMIPDSYPYAQLVIVLSMLYVQYNAMRRDTKPLPNAALALGNFGVTSTNLAPFAGVLALQWIARRDRRTFSRTLIAALGFFALAALATLLQKALFGKMWIDNWSQSLHDGGYRYAADFSFSQHWRAIYMMFVSPVLTPDIAMIDTDIVAFVTDPERAYPLYVMIVGFGLLALACLGFLTGIRSPMSWSLAAYLAFAVYLHYGKGFGLAMMKYDMFLYAGHYLFAIILLAASFVCRLPRKRLRQALTFVAIVFALVTVGNNVVKQAEALHTIRDAYDRLPYAAAAGQAAATAP